MKTTERMRGRRGGGGKGREREGREGGRGGGEELKPLLYICKSIPPSVSPNPFSTIPACPFLLHQLFLQF